MRTEINPQETTRATAFELWMSSPMPMVTLVKTLDVPHCHRSTRFSVGLSFLHPRFLHPKGHPFLPVSSQKPLLSPRFLYIFFIFPFISFGRIIKNTNFASAPEKLGVRDRVVKIVYHPEVGFHWPQFLSPLSVSSLLQYKRRCVLYIFFSLLL